jgi:hypothetical protein
MGLKYVIYSHTDFLDMLTIASDYAKNIDNKILLINDISLLPPEIVSNFKEVIVYDDTLPYTDKIAQILEKIDSKYILFTHEVDIILNVDEVIMNKFVTFMDLENIDRIDLQPNDGNTNGRYVKIVKDLDVSEWPKYENIRDPYNQLSNEEHYLGWHTDPRTYIFNVNPSIWRVSTLLELFSTFKGRTYRNIEYDDVQDYCTKYRVCNLHTRYALQCGYLKCLPFYKYLHITHHQRLLRFNGNFKDEFNQSYIDASKEYADIVNNYNLKQGKRPFS